MAENTTYTASKSDDQGITNRAVGTVTYGADAITATDHTRIRCGFRPRYVRWINITDRIEGEWFEGMAADSCLKTVAAGTRTLEVTGGNGGITVNDDGFQVLQNATLALILASKVVRWVAEG